MKDICCIGHITLDRIITPSASFHQNGGTAYYFAYGMNHLPHDVSFQIVTSIAPKDFSTIEQMKSVGIDVQCFQSKDTVFFENTYGANANKRTQRLLAKSDPFKAVQMQCVEDAQVYHLGTLLNDDFSVDAIEVLAQKGRISIDVQGFLREVQGQNVVPVDWKDKERVLAMTDVLKLNEYEMEVVMGSREPHEVARTIAAGGVREVVLTLGSYGSLIYANGHFVEIPAYSPRRCVDVTGCGDTFSAGYLYCRAKGADIAEAARFAAAMCTLKIEHQGPFCGTIQEVNQLLMNNED